MKENPIQKRIMLACSRGASRLYRMNVGLGWIGSHVKKFKSSRVITLHVQPGDVFIRNARPFRSGIEGMSDLIGWESVYITPDMVGQKIAVFVSLEVKGENGRARKAQLVWIDNVKSAGGIAGIVRSVEEAQSLLTHTRT